jgi:hypothetical protein
MTPRPLSADDIRRLFGELAAELDAAGQRPEIFPSRRRCDRAAATRGALRMTLTRFLRPPMLCDGQRRLLPIVRDSILTG